MPLLLSTLLFTAASRELWLSERVKTYPGRTDGPELARTTTVTYPVVTGPKTARKRAAAALDFDRVFGIDLASTLRDEPGSVTGAGFDHLHEGDGVLSVLMWVETMGAYPSRLEAPVVVDSTTGRRATALNSFRRTSELKVLVADALRTEVAGAVNDPAKSTEDRDLARSTLAGAKLAKDALDRFSVATQGVTFHHDYDLVHALKGLAPSGKLFFPWSKVGPFVRSDGPLRRFVRSGERR